MNIHLYTEGTELPEEDCIIIAREGFFLKQRSNWVNAIVPIKTLSLLNSLESEAELLLPSIPQILFAKIVIFFKEIYLAQRTEAAVLIHFREEDGDWQITVPEQTATGSHVEYDSSTRLPGYLCVGTAHSHCDMGAFHSATDAKDEMGHDGIHITIGRLDKFPLFEVDGEVNVRGSRFCLPDEKIEGLERISEPPAAKDDNTTWWKKRDLNKMRTMGILEEATWIPPQAWMDMVKKRTFVNAWKRNEKPKEEDEVNWWAGWNFTLPGVPLLPVPSHEEVREGGDKEEKRPRGRGYPPDDVQ
jgi:PRTRC genetic system protein A